MRATGPGPVPALALAVVAALACATAEPTPTPGPVAPPESAATRAMPVVPDTPEPPGASDPPRCRVIERIVVHKAAHRLVARCAGGAVIERRVALGRGDSGDKLREGDKRTPEGIYHVSGPPRTSRFHRFVPLDYPSLVDANRALVEGRISIDDHRRITDALAAGEPPPGDTPLGGAFGLHGEGERWQGASDELDWTLGCVAVDDETIELLAERLPVGTPVEIRP